MTYAPATSLPWRRPRHELLLLVLVGIVALLPVYPNLQDDTRICQARAFVHGSLSDDRCFANSLDSSSHGGHLYSNKAPGLAVLDIPSVELFGIRAQKGGTRADGRVWAMRLLTGGLAFLLAAFLVGRVAEGLAPGWGGAALVAFALGTLAAPLAATSFDHVPALAFGFAAFLLLWSGRPAYAGLAAGIALLIEYEAFVIVVVLAAYALASGHRAAVRYLACVLPGALLLGAYNWAAFGAPWHNPLAYSTSSYRAEHAKGILGVELPSLHATHLVFIGDRGLLVISPVLLACAYGLVILWRRGFVAETLVCLAVASAFVIAECGYFIPYGGVSPGPRFLAPALPFLGVGLGLAFARRRLVTSVLTVASVVPTFGMTLVWTADANLHQTIWGEIARTVVQGRSAHLISHLMTLNAVGLTSLGTGAGFAMMAVAAAAALVLTLTVHR